LSPPLFFLLFRSLLPPILNGLGFPIFFDMRQFALFILRGVNVLNFFFFSPPPKLGNLFLSFCLEVRRYIFGSSFLPFDHRPPFPPPQICEGLFTSFLFSHAFQLEGTQAALYSRHSPFFPYFLNPLAFSLKTVASYDTASAC